jgi:hypothetical protein
MSIRVIANSLIKDNKFKDFVKIKFASCHPSGLITPKAAIPSVGDREVLNLGLSTLKPALLFWDKSFA